MKDNAPLSNQALALHSLLIREKKINTLEARRRGINHPAGRIQDLRKNGVNIETQWTVATDQKGRLREVALYVLHDCKQMTFDDFLKKKTPQRGELGGEASERGYGKRSNDIVPNCGAMSSREGDA